MEQIEETIFSRKRWIESKMTAYGFHKVNDIYTLEKTFLDGNFKAIFSVNTKGEITGKVIDQMTLDEYYQLRQEEANGAYVHTVRTAYVSCLKTSPLPTSRDILFYFPLQATAYPKHTGPIPGRRIFPGDILPVTSLMEFFATLPIGNGLPLL